MKKSLLNLFRCIVGSEYGWTGEGNEQWYYFLALVINVMLTWWLKPELGIIFTAAAVIHYITVCVYDYFCFFASNVWYSIVYYLIHAALFIVCMLFSCKWALLTSAIVIVAYFLAPDCCGNNIFGTANIKSIFVLHTILFVAFVVIALNLPIALWIRITIIVACMVLHPIIDQLEGECMIISDATSDSFWKIVQTIKDKKNKKSC